MSGLMKRRPETEPWQVGLRRLNRKDRQQPPKACSHRAGRRLYPTHSVRPIDAVVELPSRRPPSAPDRSRSPRSADCVRRRCSRPCRSPAARGSSSSGSGSADPRSYARREHRLPRAPPRALRTRARAGSAAACCVPDPARSPQRSAHTNPSGRRGRSPSRPATGSRPRASCWR